MGCSEYLERQAGLRSMVERTPTPMVQYTQKELEEIYRKQAEMLEELEEWFNQRRLERERVNE